MKILIVGGGAREHALGIMVLRSVSEPKVYIAASNKNPGLLRLAQSSGGELITATPTSPREVVKAAEKVGPDLVIIGPEEPLFNGVSDALRDKGFLVFGAQSKLALIEKDKIFARTLMWRYNIPGRLRFKAFKNPIEAAEYAKVAGDTVIKPARQAGGRGVRVFAEPMEHLAAVARDAASEYAAKLVETIKSKYKDIEHGVIVEERVEGVEYTLMTISDGTTLIALPVVQDNPHLHPMDLGPETGGMGSISGPTHILPFLEEQEYLETLEIIEKTIAALKAEARMDYIGALAGQMMLTSLWGPTLLEYYARFGDPEIGNIIYMIESDFLELLDRAARRKLAGYKLKLKEEIYVVSKAIAPAGYPLNRKLAKGHPIAVDREKIEELGCTLLYGGVDEKNGELVTTGSRVVEIVCWSEKGFEEASVKTEKAVSYVRALDGHPLIHRWDIGSREQLESRIKLAKRVRESYKIWRLKGLKIYDWIPGKGLIIYDYE